MSKNNYGEQSLKSLKGPDQVRLRPGVIFGSDGIEGCEHSIFEILSNSIDEAREGFGSEIRITKYLDGSFEVEDKGRGIPIDYNKNEEKYNWELAFCTLYAGGKYDNTTGENYSYSLGLNGLGLCATQFAAEYMQVVSDNGTYRYHLRFEKGFNVTKNTDERGFTRKRSAGKSGTIIRWKPDRDVFIDTDVGEAYLDSVLRRQSVVNDGLRFILRIERQSESDSETDDETLFDESVYCYKNGIDDYIKEIAGENTLTAYQSWSAQRKGRDREDKEDYTVKLRCAVVFSNKVKLIEHYHNSSWLEHGGSPDKALRSAVVSMIDGYIKQAGKYQKGESKITFTDVEECLCFISSNFSNQISYENQTKKSVTNKFIAEAMTQWLKHQLEVYFIENKDDAARICEQVLVNKRSRESAEKTRQGLKKKLAGTIDMNNRVQKFVDCRSKDVTEREIYIVEGDSALGSVKLARNAEFQAVIPVRGKILNCLKNGYDKIFKNEIITDLIRVLGCGVEVTNKAAKDISAFNLNNLRWNKVVICTDADEDGFHIRTMILAMLYRLTPKLIEEGLVYIAESPLYEINCGEEVYFAYTEPEKTRIMNIIGKRKFTIQRSKGLGENEPDMMSLTTMNPKTRRLIRVLPMDAQKTAEMFDLLLGNDLAGRKDYIQENGSRYIEAADVS
jgi:DNA gyrase subunit B